MLLDRMVNLLSRGCVVPVLQYIKHCWQRGDTDISLIRYFITEVWNIIIIIIVISIHFYYIILDVVICHLSQKFNNNPKPKLKSSVCSSSVILNTSQRIPQ